MSETAAAPASETIAPSAEQLLFDPTRVYTYVPYQMLTGQVLDACLDTPNPTENKKRNPDAEGTGCWLKFDARQLKKFYPTFRCKLNDERLTIRTPFMLATWGISSFKNKPWEKTISLSYGRPKDDEAEAFADWAENVFDAFMIERISKRSKIFLGKDQSVEQIKENYQGLFRISDEDREKGYAPKTPGFKLLPKAPPVGFHGEQRKIPVTDETVHKGDYIKMDIEISTIWINRPTARLSGAVARVDIRTPKEINNDNFAIDEVNPASTEEAPQPPAANQGSDAE